MNFLANPIYKCNFSLSKKHRKNKSETNETVYLQDVGGNEQKNSALKPLARVHPICYEKSLG